MAIDEDSNTPRRPKGPHAPLPPGLVPPPPDPDAAPPRRGVYAEEDSRMRAARRAAELREHLGTMDEGVDNFYIDPAIIPDGWSYEWKRLTVLGKHDPSYEVSVARRGWEPVPVSRHPEMMPENWSGNSIERDGMILMERPLEITREAQQIERRKALGQVRQKEEQIQGAPAGANSPFPARNKEGIRKSFSHEPIPIPDK
jgi:hypothetical protein